MQCKNAIIPSIFLPFKSSSKLAWTSAFQYLAKTSFEPWFFFFKFGKKKKGSCPGEGDFFLFGWRSFLIDSSMQFLELATIITAVNRPSFLIIIHREGFHWHHNKQKLTERWSSLNFILYGLSPFYNHCLNCSLNTNFLLVKWQHEPNSTKPLTCWNFQSKLNIHWHMRGVGPPQGHALSIASHLCHKLSSCFPGKSTFRVYHCEGQFLWMLCLS